jgi:hypothetical protein
MSRLLARQMSNRVLNAESRLSSEEPLPRTGPYGAQAMGDLASHLPAERSPGQFAPNKQGSVPRCAPSKVTLRHSRESGNPVRSGVTWTPACAGVTTGMTFISLGGPLAHDHSDDSKSASCIPTWHPACSD